MTSADAWKTAVRASINAVESMLPRRKVTPIFHGLVICAENVFDAQPTINSITSMFAPPQPVLLLCAPDVSTSFTGIDLAVTQTILSFCDCFVGLEYSTFSKHVRYLRIQNDMREVYRCDFC